MRARYIYKYVINFFNDFYNSSSRKNFGGSPWKIIFILKMDV